MRKQSLYQSISLDELRLLREDVEQINLALADHFSRIYIKANGYELDNISELTDFKESFITDFSIEAYGDCGHISLTVSDYSTRLGISDANNKTLFGVFKHVEGILAQRINKRHHLKEKTGWIAYIAGLLIISVSFYLLLFNHKKIGLYLILAGLAVAACGFILTIPRRKKHGGVVLSTSEKGFWLQYKHQIALIILGSVIGATLTLIANLLLRALGNPRKP